MIKVMQMEICARVLSGHEEETEAAVYGLAEMIREFKEQKTERQVEEHVLRINGYVQALVNIGIIEEANANGSIRKAVLFAAAGREAQLESEGRRK